MVSFAPIGRNTEILPTFAIYLAEPVLFKWAGNLGNQ